MIRLLVWVLVHAIDNTADFIHTIVLGDRFADAAFTFEIIAIDVAITVVIDTINVPSLA